VHEFQVRDLVNHLYQVVVNFQALAARETVAWAAPKDQTEGDWRERFAAEAGRLAVAWSDPAALEGISPGMGMPQQAVGLMALLDLTVQGWDLARATGQPYQPDADAVALLSPMAEQMGPMAREMGVFAAQTETAPDADSFERLLARY
jgi:uncharacterized protein (TIGR03086 family)